MTVRELIDELEEFEDDTEVEVMIGFRTSEITTVGGDDDEGVYLEVSDA